MTGGLLFVILIGCLGLEVWALVDCATRKTEAFVAAGKLTKQIWLAITGAAVVLTLLFGSVFSPLFLAGVVAAIVYLVDVRPAIQEIQGGGPW